jgi:hypothetical protein
VQNEQRSVEVQRHSALHCQDYCRVHRSNGGDARSHVALTLLRAACAGKIAPEYALGADLNIGGSVVSSALCEVCGVSRGQLRELYNSMGDLGDVAQVGRYIKSLELTISLLTILAVLNFKCSELYF